MDLLHDTLRLWAQHRQLRIVHAELARHSDRELRDMGIDRGDIARLADAEAERRIVTPVPGRAEAPAPAWHDPVPAAGRSSLSLWCAGAR